jgi:hypothetical protein
MDVSAALQVLGERAAAAREDRCIFCAQAPPTQSEGEPDLGRLEAPPQAQAASSSMARVQCVIREQERRVLEYRRFEEGFARFLQVAEAEGYTSLVADSTAAFSAISKRINTATQELSDWALERATEPEAASCKVMVSLIRRLQVHEREKLTVTAQLQIVRHGIAVDELRAEHASVLASGEADAGAVDGSGTGCATAMERTMAFRREEADDLRAKLVLLSEQISEVIDEMRCELAELSEGDQA